MEINTEYRPATVTQADTGANTETTVRAQTPARPAEGTVIQGEIVDIKRGEITVRTNDGQLITGQSSKEPEALVGQKHSFTVHYDGKGALHLEIGSAPDNARAVMLTDLLKSYGMKAGSENINMLSHLLRNNFPLDQQTVKQFTQAFRLMDGDPVKALFFLQNNMPISGKNAELLNGFADGTARLNTRLQSLSDSLVKLADPVMREQLAGILMRGGEGEGVGTAVRPGGAVAGMPAGGATQVTGMPVVSGDTTGATPMALNQPGIPDALQTLRPEQFSLIREALGEGLREAMALGKPTAEQSAGIVKALTGNNIVLTQEQTEMLIKSFLESESKAASISEQNKSGGLMEKLTARLVFQMENSDPKDVDRYLNNLREDIRTAAEAIQRMPARTPETARVFDELTQVREHIDFMAHVKNNLYVQLPLLVNQKETHAELYVFRDGKKAGKGGKGVSSALIAIDTLHLGRFETYVQKKDKDVYFQFRLESDETEKLVRQNADKLNRMMQEYDYRLSGLSFKQSQDSFTLLDKEPVIGENNGFSEKSNRVLYDVRA